MRLEYVDDKEEVTSLSPHKFQFQFYNILYVYTLKNMSNKENYLGCPEQEMSVCADQCVR